MLRYTRCNIVILMAAIAWLMSFISCIVCGCDLYTVLFKCPQRKNLWGHFYDIRITSAHDTGTEGHQPCSCSHQNHRSYIGYTSTWLGTRSCVLMQGANAFSVFYDSISFQHLAAVLISVFTLRYRTGLLFRGPSCIKQTYPFFHLVSHSTPAPEGAHIPQASISMSHNRQSLASASAHIW